ncbi:MAG: transposase [Nanoarchaeota archaeon]|nr:transposase [Nanoarchaeota archaeon]
MLSNKFRLYPNKEQTEKLEFALDTCRQAYNMMLGELNDQVVIDRNMIQAILPDLKICEPRFREVYSKTLQYECYRLFSNLSALRVLKGKGKRVGQLKFQGKKFFTTITYNQSGFELEHTYKKNGRLKLSKIGDIKVKLHRIPEGKVKQITIKRINDKWFAFVISDGKKVLEHGNKVLGIDLGINSYLVDSEGNKVEHPKLYEKMQRRLRIANQNLSRKKKGSKNRIKARKSLSKIYEKLTNQRNDFLHKTSTNLIKKCKIIVVEDLNIKSMMEQKYFNAKNIADSSWNKFIQMLEYKSENSGVQIIKVNPKDTTKTCSNCGHIQKMPLWVRTYKCENCLFEMCRDKNSAINIKNKGLGEEITYVEIMSDSSSEGQLSMKQEALTSMEC